MMHEVKTIPEVLSGRVRQVRERRGISLRELSRRIDDLGYTPIDASGLMRLENGTRRATVEDVISISMALDVAPVSLLAPLSDEKVFLPGLGERDAHDVRGWIAGRILPVEPKPPSQFDQEDTDRISRWESEHPDYIRNALSIEGAGALLSLPDEYFRLVGGRKPGTTKLRRRILEQLKAAIDLLLAQEVG